MNGGENGNDKINKSKNGYDKWMEVKIMMMNKGEMVKN